MTGVVVRDLHETYGLGREALTDTAFLGQFLGTAGEASVGKDIEALTGATVTSKAIAKGVNSAAAFVTGADVSSSAPELNVAVVTAVCLAALVVERYLAPGARRAWVPLILLGGVTLGLLPWCAGLVSAAQALELCLLGGAVFAVTAMLYTSMADRLSSGPVCRAAPVLSAFLLFLAGQCLTGLLL